MLSASALLLAPAAQASTSVSVQIGVAPPPPRVEYAPRPRRGHLWVGGYWAWTGRQHVWVEGHWERERRGYRYVEPRWVLVNNQWVFYEGRWDPYGAPLPVVVQPAAPPVYVERAGEPAPAPAAAAPKDPNFWYYCRNPDGYYPYVKECAGGWQKVDPVPPQRP